MKSIFNTLLAIGLVLTAVAVIGGVFLGMTAILNVLLVPVCGICFVLYVLKLFL